MKNLEKEILSTEIKIRISPSMNEKLLKYSKEDGAHRATWMRKTIEQAIIEREKLSK